MNEPGSWLHRLDRQRDELAARHPGWRIWYVPHAVDRSVTWCGQRLPLLNCGSPEELEEEIGHVEPGGEAWLERIMEHAGKLTAEQVETLRSLLQLLRPADPATAT